MSNSVVANPVSFNKGLDQHYKRFEKKFASKMRVLMEAGMVRLLRRTPVWTGQAVASYVASSGSAMSRSAGAPKPVEATNKLSLGAEQLRGPAEARARSTLGNVKYGDPFTVYWITNAAPHIGGLESGSYPTEPFVPRSPAGMFAVTLQELAAMLESGL